MKTVLHYAEPLMPYQVDILLRGSPRTGPPHAGERYSAFAKVKQPFLQDGGCVTTQGQWLDETFLLEGGRPGKVKMSKNDWHEVLAVVRPGQKVEIQVDGQSLGRLNCETLAALAFSADDINSTYVDDIELFYAD